MLKTRLLTAAILIPLFIAALFYLPLPGFMAVVSIILLLAGWEWTHLMAIRNPIARLGYILLVACLAVAVLAAKPHVVLFLAIFWWLMAAWWISRYPRDTTIWGRRWVLAWLGTIILIPCWYAIVILKMQSFGAPLLLMVFSIIWATDSAAYFGGRQWGKRKLASAVSPGKTWVGFYSGLLGALVTMAIFLTALHIPMRFWWCWLLLALATAIFSVIGDLFESMVKRVRGVKDSGVFVPGHGGVLDRIDSLTAAMPVFCLGVLQLIYHQQITIHIAH